MLRDARMAGLVKLHCVKGVTDERQEWAVLAGLSCRSDLQRFGYCQSVLIRLNMQPSIL